MQLWGGMNFLPIAICAAALPLLRSSRAEAASAKDITAKLDAYLDHRWDAPPGATDDLIRELKLEAPEVERLLRSGRASYPAPPQPKGKLSTGLPLSCDHVDHSTKYMIYVPKGYDPAKASPLILVAHGGSAGRDVAFGERAAIAGIVPFWIEAAGKHGCILLAPITDRGWGAIGNSIALSALSKIQREYHVDPDRIYVTGHSMGGHMTWRSAMTMADRWGAVSPMSGGYDYVKDKQVYACFNVPGYATWGTTEPYGINGFNKTIAAWLESHRFEWVMREKDGGHQIFPDEVARVAEFFASHPRNLYREAVYARGSGSLTFHRAEEKRPEWPAASTWNAARPIPTSTCHWLRLLPLPADTAPEKSLQSVSALNKGGNAITITAENARRLRIYLHPEMVDFAKPVTITINGTEVFNKPVHADLRTLLELAREFDDRGRIFYTAVEVDVPGSRTPDEPAGKQP